MKEPKERLRIVRKSLDLTQEQLAVSIGINRVNITDMEAGRTRLTTPIALALEHIHNINSQWLLHEEGDMFVEKSTSVSESAETVVPMGNSVVREHQQLVTRFRDAQRAKIINEDLLTIEQLSGAAWERTASYIRGVADTLRVVGSDIQQESKSKAVGGSTSEVDD